MLEDKIHGPLYKVILSRGAPKSTIDWAKHLLTGPSPISVSKINQLISLFVTLIWVGLLIDSLPTFDLSSPLNWYYTVITALTLIVCIAFVTVGRSYNGGYWHRATIRTTKINNEA
jgi:hypothetical protein